MKLLQDEIKRLLIQGYTERRIVMKLEISRSTISRDIRKIGEEKNQCLEEITHKYGFVFEHGLVLDRLNDCIAKAYEVLRMANTANERLAVIKVISSLSVLYWEKYSSVPLAASMKKFVYEKQMKVKKQ